MRCFLQIFFVVHDPPLNLDHPRVVELGATGEPPIGIAPRPASSATSSYSSPGCLFASLGLASEFPAMAVGCTMHSLAREPQAIRSMHHRGRILVSVQCQPTGSQTDQNLSERASEIFVCLMENPRAAAAKRAGPRTFQPHQALESDAQRKPTATL